MEFCHSSEYEEPRERVWAGGLRRESRAFMSTIYLSMATTRDTAENALDEPVPTIPTRPVCWILSDTPELHR